ncbi:hypothetical protein FACS1894200_07630 [Spirochaetia bacterium]|nr:hypothetical protein FACS1894200_07630 [Spirochaetia bacterium]
MLLTFQGFFENDRFISSEPVKMPEHRKVIVTVLDEPVFDKELPELQITDSSALAQQSEEEFLAELFKGSNSIITPPKYTGPITEEYLGKSFIHTKGWKFDREEANGR